MRSLPQLAAQEKVGRAPLTISLYHLLAEESRMSMAELLISMEYGLLMFPRNLGLSWISICGECSCVVKEHTRSCMKCHICLEFPSGPGVDLRWGELNL